MTRIGTPAELPAGTVVRAGKWAAGNNGAYFATSRRCRHLGADLSEGSIDAADGCLVCPWHASKYDVKTGLMVRGPQGAFAKVPGLGAMFKAITRVHPLRRRPVVEREGALYVED